MRVSSFRVRLRAADSPVTFVARSLCGGALSCRQLATLAMVLVTALSLIAKTASASDDQTGSTRIAYDAPLTCPDAAHSSYRSSTEQADSWKIPIGFQHLHSRFLSAQRITR
jgi:hypothetical protein